MTLQHTTRRPTAITSAMAALSLSALLAWAPAHAAQMDKAAYNTGKDRIEAEHKAAMANCKSLQGNAKDVCGEEAKAREKVARAELEHAHTGKASDARKLQEVKADTAYSVAKERCDDQTGNAKDVCVKEAKATHAKALADLKLQKEVTTAGNDARDTKREADLKVANEKCDALSGAAKDSCQADAKARFGKM